MTETLMVALWKAPNADVDALLAEWSPLALAHGNVQSLTVNVAVEDQGPYAKGEPVDLMLKLGLDMAHDLDDVPARDVLYGAAREVNVWRVDVRTPKAWDRTWPDGEFAPGVKMMSFMRRAEALSHEQFVRHWTENHTPLAIKHHVGLWNYTQNVVRRTYTPGGASIDGIAELHFRTRESWATEFFDDDDGRAVIMEDVKRFMSKPGKETALMQEQQLR